MKNVEFFRNRRSIREYLPEEVPHEKLLRVLEAFRWAPSAHNAQPWRLIVVRDSDTKRRLAEAMASHWDRDMERDGVPEMQRENLTKASIRRFAGAPLLVIVCLTMEGMDKYPDRRRQEIEHVMAVQSVAAATENMHLAAHLEGLGSCWFCAPLFCPDTVQEVLRIPSQFEPQALITMGYPAEKPEPPPRTTLEEIVYLYPGRRME